LLALPLVLAAGAYARVLGGGFVFDDRTTALSPAVKDLGAQARALVPALLRGGRPVVDLSLALNYAASGAEAWSYHAVNIAIHLATVLLVFAFTLRTLQFAGVSRIRGPALAVAGIFALHPLHSQAVSYVSQRAETLASAFYLTTLVLLLAAERVARTPGRTLLRIGAYCVFLLGLGTKQIVVTMPFAYLLLTMAVPGRRQDALQASWPKRLVVLAPFVATAGWYVHQLLVSVEGHRDVGAAVPGMTPWTYFLTQWKVLLIYLRLVFWPAGQCLDWRYPVTTHPDAGTILAAVALTVIFWPAGQCLDWRYPVTTHPDAGTILAAVALTVIAGGAVAVLWWFRDKVGEDAAAVRIAGFGVLWFFLLLAPTSSFVPIADVLVEHRVYLASWGIFAAVVLLLGRALARFGEEHRRIVGASLVGALWCMLALCLRSRNGVWEDPIVLWSDVVAKAPGNMRAHVQLAAAHQVRGDLERAAAEYGRALHVVAPDDIHYQVQARLGLGASLVDLGRVDDGIAVIEGALARDPNDAEILASLAEAWWHRGDRAQAESFAERAVAAKPDLGNALLVLGVARKARGDLEDAAEALARAVRANPDTALPRLTLAGVYAQLGRTGEACGVWRGILRLPAALPEERARASREASGLGCQGL
jgi:tetratricopeptide (TPR) repeat protein